MHAVFSQCFWWVLKKWAVPAVSSRRRLTWDHGGPPVDIPSLGGGRGWRNDGQLRMVSPSHTDVAGRPVQQGRGWCGAGGRPCPRAVVNLPSPAPAGAAAPGAAGRAPAEPCSAASSRKKRGNGSLPSICPRWRRTYIFRLMMGDLENAVTGKNTPEMTAATLHEMGVATLPLCTTSTIVPPRGITYEARTEGAH